jgi:hypothetical protein
MLNQKLIFYTDSPPLLEGGSGNSGIAVQIIHSIYDRLAFVLTRKFRRSISRDAIYSACKKRLVLHPDASGYGIKKISPWIGSVLDFLLFAFWMFFSKGIRSKKNAWFILCGGDCWFLLHILLIQKLGISTHIYLVDEIETSARSQQPRCLQFWIRPALARVLKNCSSVFAISEGFVEYLKSEFQCNARWLPLPSQPKPSAAAILPRGKKFDTNIVFTGALNALYLGPLKDLYEEISELNKKSEMGLFFKLEVLSYCPPDALISLLSDQDHLVFRQNLPAKERIMRMSQAAACFLPYSFSESERLMVSTSFSCKIIEYFLSGSLIFVYGPKYASIPRYFIKENLPVCTTSRAELRQALANLYSIQQSDYLNNYQAIWKKNHSPSAFVKTIFSNLKVPK